ncbi:MAG: adenosylhomocysteinase [Candidatus Lokiarchaeota archaeon]|nr:adenosylhomocysteinase [Candidatus Lokiarchaeota archaeon]MBD3340183.1 adenosylhomocysteinase [Candidatus Lokiarchaeota archaeon]
MVKYKIADESLAEKGKEALYIAENKMPVTAGIIRDRFKKEKPLEGIRIAGCLHVTKETANLARTLKAGGADVWLCGSNPLSTQDDVTAALVKEDVNVFAWHGNTDEEFYWCIRQCLKAKPNILIDDGADMIVTAHKEFPELIENGIIIACQEETTTGVKRFRAMEKQDALQVPLFPVNDARCKNQFDNELGTGQGVVAAIYGMHVLFAGRTVVIAGYGHCSSGMALRSKGLGANVIVTEVDPIKALQARFAGYQVMPIEKTLPQADILLTATGCKHVIPPKTEVFDTMKDGIVLGNLGHFDIEIPTKELYEYATEIKPVRSNVEELIFPTGKKAYLLAKGRLANLVLSEGHPSEVMDMSFGLQSLMSEYIVKNKNHLKPGIIEVPKDIDDRVGYLKLKAMNIEIDELTEEQYNYIHGYEEGT